MEKSEIGKENNKEIGFFLLSTSIPS